MKIIVILKRDQSKPADAFASLADAEAKVALGMVAEDFVREIYSMANGAGAVMIIEAEGENEVRERLSALPFVQNDLLTFEIFPLTAYRAIKQAAGA